MEDEGAFQELLCSERPTIPFSQVELSQLTLPQARARHHAVSLQAQRLPPDSQATSPWEQERWFLLSRIQYLEELELWEENGWEQKRKRL